LPWNRSSPAQAKRAGEQYGIEVVGHDVAGIADYLYNAALRLSP
jgi:hypothetical protein